MIRTALLLSCLLPLFAAVGLAVPMVAQVPVQPDAEGQKSPAQDPSPQEPKPLPVDVEAEASGRPIRRMALIDALRLGRTNNVELRTAELLPAQAMQDLLAAEAIFQPELYGDVGFSESRRPNSSTISFSQKQQTIDATLGWRQRVLTGGLFDLAFQPARFSTEADTTFTIPERQFRSEWSLTYTQPLLRGAWTDYTMATIQASRHQLAQSQQEYERAVQDTLLAVVEAYWELVFVRENYRVVTEALGVAEEQLRITEERIRVRQLAPRDRVADEAEVARRREELIAADNQIRRREDDLRRLLFDDREGLIWQWNIRPVDDIAIYPDDSSLDFDSLAAEAVKYRPDLKALRSRVATAEIDLLQARRDTLPGLDLVSSYSSDGVRDEQFMDAFNDSIDQTYPDWGVRLQFAIPIGNQAARARERRAELEVERRQRDLYGATLDVTKEVREAVRNMTSLSQSIRASAESVRLAESNLETEQVKLRVGSSTAFEVQRRNQELRESRSRHLRNQLDYRIARSRLRHAQGRLGDEEQ